MRQVTCIEQATDWKDRAVGWATWRGIVDCPECGKPAPAIVAGRYDDARAYAGRCDACIEREDQPQSR